MIAFSKPYYEKYNNWIDIKIGNDTYHASFLTDVPIDLIDGALVMLQLRLPFILEIDPDTGGHYTFINSRLQRELMVTDSFDIKGYKYIEPLDLAKGIYEYLTGNLEAIYNWFVYEKDEREKAKYRAQIDEGIERLREAINSSV